MLLRTICGNEQFQAAFAKFHVFWVPTNGTGKEMHIGTAQRDTHLTGIRRSGQSDRRDARPGHIEEFGYWTIENYDVADGAMLKVFGSRLAGYGGRRTTASQFLLVRSGAALRKLSMSTLGLQGWALQEVYIQGNFDLLTQEEGVELGGKVLPQFRRQFEESETHRIFTVQVIEPETKARVRMRNQRVRIAGTDHSVQIEDTPRRIDV